MASRVAEGVSGSVLCVGYINSTIEATTNPVVSATILQDIQRISLEHPELQTAAAEVANAPQGSGRLQKLAAWITLANSIAGLAEKSNSITLNSTLSFLA